MALNPSFIDGLALLETAGGKKTVKGPNGEDSYNLFNIKDFSGKGFRAYDKAEGSRDAYRVYGNADEAKADLMGLLSRKYPAAIAAETPEQFAAALKKGGYATDPLYVSKLVKAIKSVNPGTVTASTLAPYSEAYADTIAEARKRGYSDDEIAAKLSTLTETAGDQAQAGVASKAAQSKNIAEQLNVLRNNGYGETINEARKRGYSDDEIVSTLAGQGQSAGQAAKARYDAKSALQAGFEGAADTVGSLARGTRQVFNEVTGDKDTAKRLYAEEAANRADLDNQALRAGTAGQVGSMLPYAAAALIPGANTVAGGAAIGAGTMGLQPVTEDESRLQNMATGAALGGAATGLVKGAGKLWSEGGQAAKQLAARPGAEQAVRNEEQRLLNRAITARAGNEADVLDSSWVAQTKSTLGKRLDDAMDGVDVALSDDAVKALEAATSSGRLPIDYRREVRRLLYSGVDENGAPVRRTAIPMLEVDKLARMAGKDLGNQNLTAFKRETLGELAQTLEGAKDAAMNGAGKAQALADAKEQYRNFVVARDAVVRSGDVDQVSPKVLKQAAKAGRFKNQFAEGRAPMQDIIQKLDDLPEEQASSVIAKLLESDAMGIVGQAARITGTGRIAALIARKVLSSSDPKVRSVFYNLNPVEQSKILTAAAGA